MRFLLLIGPDPAVEAASRHPAAPGGMIELRRAEMAARA